MIWRTTMKNSELIDLLAENLANELQAHNILFVDDDIISDCVKNWIIDNQITMSNNESPICKICGFQMSEEESKKNNGICYDCNLNENL